jgi:hypothetical protein
MAETLKAQANEAFKRKEFDEAEGLYSSALLKESSIDTS